MDYLQYLVIIMVNIPKEYKVLNLIINGLPSIQFNRNISRQLEFHHKSFKPYYKWITFNTNE